MSATLAVRLKECYGRVDDTDRSDVSRRPDMCVGACRYLGCIDVKELQEGEAVELANDLCLAALLGDGIYNMGELLSHGIVDFLRDTQQQWLVDLVMAFNSGDVAGYARSPTLLLAGPQSCLGCCVLCCPLFVRSNVDTHTRSAGSLR